MEMKMQVKVKKLSETARLPTYATGGSGAFDLYCSATDDNEEGLFYTDLVFEVPPGHVMLVFSRSGHAFNHSVRLANCVGVIDSDYRGELLIKLCADYSDLPELEIFGGDRIAQAIILPIPCIEFLQVEELSSTARAQNGFGSTGK